MEKPWHAAKLTICAFSRQQYTVPSKGRVSVEVFDVSGSHVRTLVDAVMDAGAHTETWSGRDTNGHVVSSGVYFARVMHSSGTRSYAMVLLK